MNKNDFYRELFEKYALDADKIRLDALKQGKTPAWKRVVSEYWKPATGIAAAVAVTVGVVAYTTANPPGLDITVSDSTAISAAERLREAELNYYRNPDDDSRVDIYLTFWSPMSYTDISVALSAVRDDNDIDVTALYLTDGELINKAAELHSFAENNGDEKCVGGVKVVASAECYCDIQDLSSVYLAEKGSPELNDDTFTLMPVEDNDPLSGDITDTAETAVTTAFSFEAVQPTETTVPVTEQTSLVPETSVQSVSSATEETTPAPDESESATASDTTVAPETEDTSPDFDDLSPVITDEVTLDYDEQQLTEAETDEPEFSDTDDSEALIDEDVESEFTVTEEIDDSNEEIDDPDPEDEISVSETSESHAAPPETEPGHHEDKPIPGLMTQLYQLNVPDSCATLLVKNYAVVLTKDKAYFYSVGGVLDSREIMVCDIISPKISCSDDNTVIVTGCSDEGIRNIMIVLDTADGSVTEKDVSSNLGNAEIGTINYSESENKFYIKAINSSYTYVYETSIDDEDEMIFRPLFEFPGAVSMAGERNRKLYYTASDDNVNYSLYSFDCTDGTVTTLCSFDSVCRIKRSPSFDSFIIDVSGETECVYVFDTAEETLIKTDMPHDEARIAVSGATIYIELDGKVYTLSDDGTLTEAPGRMIQFTKELHTGYIIHESDNEKIIISEKGTRW